MEFYWEYSVAFSRYNSIQFLFFDYFLFNCLMRVNNILKTQDSQLNLVFSDVLNGKKIKLSNLVRLFSYTQVCWLLGPQYTVSCQLLCSGQKENTIGRRPKLVRFPPLNLSKRWPPPPNHVVSGGIYSCE